MNLRSHLGFQPRIGDRVFIDESARVIGRVVLGDDASVWPFAVVRGDVQSIEIGARTNIQDGCVLHVVHDGPHSPGGLALTVGEDVTIGHKAVLHAATIGSRCLVGIGSIVLDGAVVPDDTIIGAGSLVPPGKRLAARGLYLGNPVRRIRDLEDHEVERIVYGARHYVRVKDEHRAACAAAVGR